MDDPNNTIEITGPMPTFIGCGEPNMAVKFLATTPTEHMVAAWLDPELDAMSAAQMIHLAHKHFRVALDPFNYEAVKFIHLDGTLLDVDFDLHIRVEINALLDPDLEQL